MNSVTITVQMRAETVVQQADPQVRPFYLFYYWSAYLLHEG